MLCGWIVLIQQTVWTLVKKSFCCCCVTSIVFTIRGSHRCGVRWLKKLKCSPRVLTFTVLAKFTRCREWSSDGLLLLLPCKNCLGTRKRSMLNFIRRMCVFWIFQFTFLGTVSKIRCWKINEQNWTDLLILTSEISSTVPDYKLVWIRLVVLKLPTKMPTHWHGWSGDLWIRLKQDFRNQKRPA